MVVTFKTNSDITLDCHDFSKRQWRKICQAFGAEKEDKVLWIEVSAGAVEFACKPTDEEVREFARKERK